MSHMPNHAATTRSSASRLGIGVIGLGAMGTHHAELVAARGDASLIAVTDPVSERRHGVGSRLGAAIEPSVESVVCRMDVDAVIIASPVETHVEAIRLCAGAGKGILCEKPLAGSVGECQAAIAACEEAGVRLQVGFMRRYDPGYRDALDAVRAGEIGAPVLVTSISRDASPPSQAYLTSDAAANLFLESAVHDFDLARWFLNDEVEAVVASGSMLPCQHLAPSLPIDFGQATLHFSRGAVASIQNYKNAGYGYDIRTEIVGTAGMIRIGGLPEIDSCYQRFELTSPLVTQHWRDRFSDAYPMQLDDWIRRMSGGLRPLVTGDDGLRATAIGEACERSRISGRMELVTYI
jgi:predicted dehydrogenase